MTDSTSATQGSRTARLRGVLSARPRAVRLAVAAVVTVATAVVAPTLLPDYSRPAALTAGAVTGAVMAFGYLAHRQLSARLGRLTAVAALSVVTSVVLMVLALSLPHCPGGAARGGDLAARCGSADVGTWMTIGVVLPATVAVLVGGPLLVARLAHRVGRLFIRLTTRHRGTPEADKSLLTRLRDRQHRALDATASASKDPAPRSSGDDEARRARRRAARAARRTTRRNR